MRHRLKNRARQFAREMLTSYAHTAPACIVELHRLTRNERMSTVRFIIAGTVKDGQVGAFADLGSRMSAAVAANEPGTTTYNWFISDDGSFINEDGYTDSAALGAHLGRAQESGLLDEYVGLVDITGVHVLGDVDDAAKGMLEAFGAVHYSQTQGR
jgi:quinol monooxygenase YgiN